MSLYQKLILFMLAASLGPLTAVGFSVLSASERELKARIGAQQATAAESAAQMAGRDVDEAVESLVRAAAPIPFGTLSQEELLGALRLVYQQSSRFSAVALLASDGSEVLPVVSREDAAARDEGRLPLSAEELLAFRAALPLGALATAGKGTVALSPPYSRPSARAAAAAVCLVVELGGKRGFLAAEVSLRSLQERSARLSAGGAGSLFLLDGEGRIVAGPAEDALLLPASAEDRLCADAAVKGASISRYIIAGRPYLAAAARTPGALGWTALIRLPEEDAFAPVAKMRRTVLVSAGGALLLLLSAGLLFTRGIARGIRRVSQGAEAYGRGDLSLRIPVVGSDEMSALARTFNTMGGELFSARRKLETWNEELQQKVEERTAELKKTQAQLLESQKLAAVGQLGAGVAHELNTPLAGILGNVQLLLLDQTPGDPEAASLKKIEVQARRAKEITHNLLRFSQQREQAELKTLDVNRLVRDALSFFEGQVRDEGVELVLELAEPLPEVKGDSGHLSQVVMHLVANARTAMMKSPTKRLTLETALDGAKVLVRVSDTGKGIPEKNLPRVFEPFFTTKDVWANVGLGLSVSYRIASEHGGRLSVASEEGRGSVFTLELPAVAATALAK